MSDIFNHEADAWDDLLFNERDDGSFALYVGYRRVGRACKFCGKSDLFWHKINDKWKLCPEGTGKPHDCV